MISSLFCHNTVSGDIDHLETCRRSLVYCVNGFLLMKVDKQNMVNILDAVVKYIHSISWKINSMII